MGRGGRKISFIIYHKYLKIFIGFPVPRRRSSRCSSQTSRICLRKERQAPPAKGFGEIPNAVKRKNRGGGEEDWDIKIMGRGNPVGISQIPWYENGLMGLHR